MRVTVVSDTIQEFNGERFYLCGNYFQHNGKRLHVTVWKHHRGDIPKGYHIHHIDGDRSNNQIENLAILTGSLHVSMHNAPEIRGEYQQKHIQEIQELAKEWHHSDAGRAWHSEHAVSQWENGTFAPIERGCAQCGKKFMRGGINAKRDIVFCSNRCKSAWRRAQGYDNEERVCEYCGKTYVVNHYARNKYCSPECAVAKRWGR